MSYSAKKFKHSALSLICSCISKGINKNLFSKCFTTLYNIIGLKNIFLIIKYNNIIIWINHEMNCDNWIIPHIDSR